MAIIMMLSLTTSVFATNLTAAEENGHETDVVEETVQSDPSAAASPAPAVDSLHLSTVYEGHRIHYIDSPKQPLSKNAELHMNEIDEGDIPWYLQRAAHALGLQTCSMYLYFIADPLLEDAATAEILKYESNPDDDEDRMIVEVTLFDDHGMTDEETVRFASACSAMAISRFPLPLYPPKLEEVSALVASVNGEGQKWT